MARVFTRILVPTDFSAPGDAALAYAKSIATAVGASVHLLHVVEDPLVPAVGEGFGAVSADLPEVLRERAEAELEERFTAADRTRFGGSTMVRTSPVAAKAITEAAEEIGADLIVMGTHGRTGLAHLVLGSVAERVVRTAGCAVLTVRQAPVHDPILQPSVAPAV